MSSGQLNIDEIRQFYEEVPTVWPKDDLWHQYSKNQINQYIQKQNFDLSSYILNAGSGGSDYGLSNCMQHVDIAENKINHCKDYTVASIEALPFTEQIFNDAICVGSVINYCDAVAAIRELSRVLKSKGTLILEFESSWGFEHRRKIGYKQSATIVELPYFGKSQKQWLYSVEYIKNILTAANFKIISELRFHYLSGLSFSKYQDENKATGWTKYDPICRQIPVLRKHSNNIILTCHKL